jgi:hypothetical protein
MACRGEECCRTKRHRQHRFVLKGLRPVRERGTSLTRGASLEDGAPLYDVLNLHSKSPVEVRGHSLETEPASMKCEWP